MSRWFRSSEMEYVQIICPQSVVFKCVQLLGEQGSFQFIDQYPNKTTVQRGSQHRLFAHAIKEIKRCDNMERILRYLNQQARKSQVMPSNNNDLEGFNNGENGGFNDKFKFDQVLKLLKDAEVEVRTQTKLVAQHTRDMNVALELNRVLKAAKQRYAEGNAEAEPDRESLLMNMDTGSDDVRIEMIGGVVDRKVEQGLLRQIFRASRSNAITYFSPIDDVQLFDPDTQEPANLSVVLVFFQRSEELKKKIQKCCVAYGARTYPLPDIRKRDEVDAMIDQTNQDYLNTFKIRNAHFQNLQNMLRIRIVDNLEKWTVDVRQEKSAHHNITKFKVQGDINSQNLIAYGWVLKSKSNDLAMGLQNLGDMGQTPIMTRQNKDDWPGDPPTHFDTNKVTSVFQGIVNTYGIPRYQEANPALFEVIMFPFLFGVMYGDIGHATVLLLVSIYFIRNEKELGKPGALGDMAGMAFGGRYMLLLMSIFAIYMGFIYNDMFSLNLPLFASTWEPSNVKPTKNNTLVPAYKLPTTTYPFGMDPTWRIAGNQLSFVNSFKMKMSVILGVSQMLFGVLLKFSNAIHFKKPLDLIFECIPMLAFGLGIFGYMLFLIFYKWSIDWHGPEGMAGGYGPPSLIVNILNMVLSPGSVQDAMYGRVPEKWPVPGKVSRVNLCTVANGCGQAKVQNTLLILSGLCIPLILLPKPLLLYYCKNRDHRRESEDSLELPYMDHDERKEQESPDGDDDDAGHDAGGHGEGLGDLMIHQIIETIEFVLGFVSNTASYLRLWALSLAHGQLSEVFWGKAMLATINMSNFAAVFCGYYIWAAASIGVLCLMDPLECFLHALRLHWVEFQDKFFYADGYLFEPYDLKKIDGKLTAET